MNKLILSVALALLSIFQQTKSPNSYEKFLDVATTEFFASAGRINEEFKLGEYWWHLDQDTRKLTFSENGKVKVIADAQIVGSYSTYSHTWKWSWANDTVDDGMKKDIGKVKAYGEQHGYKDLTTARWECDEDDARTMTAVAGYLLKSKGAYRGPMEDGYVFILITDIKWADGKP